MDNPWSSDFSRGEMIPPVPAPRYKRKLITNEDSKLTFTEQNTCVSEQTCNIMPPPRRKNKIQTYHNKIISPLDIADIDLDNRVKAKDTSVNNDASETSEFVRDQTLRPHSGSNNLEQSVVNTSNLLNDTIFEPNFEKSPQNGNELLEVDRQLTTLENKPVVGTEVSRNIFENFIDNRVLDFPLENKLINGHDEEITSHNNNHENVEENRVNSSLSENSATIVGVFYKNDHSINKDDLLSNTLINFDHSSQDGYIKVESKKSSIAGCKTEYIKSPTKQLAKDSEENDSGVYFSDNKSPPHKESEVINEVTNCVLKSELAVNTDFELCTPLSSNNSDIADNKDLNDFGPQNYRSMLDYFEAQTVNDFRKEITSRFCLINEEINKKETVSDWLVGEESLVKKRYNNLSLYLRNMLDSESNAASPMLTPLSFHDEDDGSSMQSDDGMQSNGLGDRVHNRKSAVEVCNDSSSLTNTQRSRSIDPSDNVGFPDDKINVNNPNVYISCIKVTPTNSKCTDYSNSFVNSSFLEFSDHTMFETSCLASDMEEMVKTNDDEIQIGDIIESNRKSDARSSPKRLVNQTDRIKPSPSIRPGAVSSLINFFENLKNQQNIPVVDGDYFTTEGEEGENHFDCMASVQTFLEENAEVQNHDFEVEGSTTDFHMDENEEYFCSSSNISGDKNMEVPIDIGNFTPIVMNNEVNWNNSESQLFKNEFEEERLIDFTSTNGEDNFITNRNVNSLNEMIDDFQYLSDRQIISFSKLILEDYDKSPKTLENIDTDYPYVYEPNDKHFSVHNKNKSPKPHKLPNNLSSSFFHETGRSDELVHETVESDKQTFDTNACSSNKTYSRTVKSEEDFTSKSELEDIETVDILGVVGNYTQKLTDPSLNESYPEAQYNEKQHSFEDEELISLNSEQFEIDTDINGGVKSTNEMGYSSDAEIISLTNKIENDNDPEIISLTNKIENDNDPEIISLKNQIENNNDPEIISLTNKIENVNDPEIISLTNKIENGNDPEIISLTNKIENGNDPEIISLTNKIGNDNDSEIISLTNKIENDNDPEIISLTNKIENDNDPEIISLTNKIENDNDPEIISLTNKIEIDNDPEMISLANKIENDSDPEIIDDNSLLNFHANEVINSSFQLIDKEQNCGPESQKSPDNLLCTTFSKPSSTVELFQGTIQANNQNSDLNQLHSNETYSSEDENEKNFGYRSEFDKNKKNIEVPTVFSDTKELISSNEDITNLSFKPKTIPVVVLSEIDVESHPIGSIELNSTGALQEYNTDESKALNEEETSDSYSQYSEICLSDETPLNDTINVVLEKNWGSLGLKIAGDEHGLVISDIMDGGSADQSALVFKGWVDTKQLQEETEIFC